MWIFSDGLNDKSYRKVHNEVEGKSED